MSHFYGDIKGSRGEATRCGHASSGVSGHLRGWAVGVRVLGSVSGGVDSFDIYLTSGSNRDGSDKLIGTFTRKEFDAHEAHKGFPIL